MMRSAIVLLLAIGFLADGSSAQDEKKKKKGKQRGGRNMATQLMARFKDVGLNEEQKTKMKEIVKKFSGSMQELRKAQNSALPAELRKARTEAGKKARGEGLKGKALQEAINKAAPISEEIAAKMKESQQKMAAMQKELREALTGVLTDEQKAKLPKRGGKAGEKKKKKKKSDK